MNEDMPWVNLTQDEVNELRNKKFELTQYGKQKLRELMDKDLIFKTNGKETSRMTGQFTLEDLTVGSKAPETKLEIKMTEPLQAKVSTEDYNKVVKASQLTHEEMLEIAERREKSNRVLQRYNEFYNAEVSGLSHGMPTSMEQLQAIALDCALASLRCENLNHEFDMVPTADIEDLIEALYQQGRDCLERVQEFKDSADGVA